MLCINQPRKRTTAALSRVLAVLVMTGLMSPLSAQTADDRGVALPGHVVKALARATRLPHAPPMDSAQITLTIVLNLSDPDGAAAFRQDIADPNSPNYHRTVSMSEYTARFGPSQEAWNTVLSYLEQNGFVLSVGSANRRTMTVRGSRAQAQAAFHVAIDDYTLGTRTFHGVANDPALPASLAPLIASISGLTNLATWHPSSLPSPQTPMSYATAYDGTLTAAGTTNAGGLPPGLNGSGQIIGLLEFDSFEITDVIKWLSHFGLPTKLADQVQTIQIAGGTTATGSGTTEVLLDIDAALGIAQGAKIRVYTAPQNTDIALAVNFAESDLYDKVNSTTGAVLSISWGVCEDDVGSADAESVDGIAADAAAYGIAIFAATGDHGSTCVDPQGNYPNSIPVPADAPHVIAVGGTTLDVDAGNSYHHESWWDSGGFGLSAGSAAGFFAEPSYQAKDYPGATGRSVPDVAIEAGDGLTLCEAASPFPECDLLATGTSLAAPLWAAIWTIANQATVDAGAPVWSPAGSYFYTKRTGFHGASTMTGPGNDFQHVGLGSPDITVVLANAVPPAISSFTPAKGPGAGGTKLTVHGAGFIGVEKVNVGGVEATHLAIKSDTELTVDTPAAAGESASIEVVTPGGTAKAPGAFGYEPEITGVSPRNGPMEGGMTVTVTGRALGDGLTFDFGGSGHAATKLACKSSTTCTMQIPAHAPGTVDVVAIAATASTSSPVVSADQFTYDSPAITAITPLVGPTSGGLFIAVSGKSFRQGATTVSFGGADATDVHCPDPAYCYMNNPAHAAGKVFVSVTVDGIASAPYPLAFNFEVFPRVTSISPAVGPPGTIVTITGKDFSTVAGDTTFTFFGIPVSGTCASSTQCTVAVPAEPYGSAQFTMVTATVNGNTSIDSVEFSFPRAPPPPPCKGNTCS
jgi:kumamolisin